MNRRGLFKLFGASAAAAALPAIATPAEVAPVVKPARPLPEPEFDCSLCNDDGCDYCVDLAP